ncbi:hypothetical protein HBI97_148120 [Parastagonospora nodorum]|nr:hypothetical protein HBI97_148120 [Parastagonospora nodorum]
MGILIINSTQIQSPKQGNRNRNGGYNSRPHWKLQTPPHRGPHPFFLHHQSQGQHLQAARHQSRQAESCHGRRCRQGQEAAHQDGEGKPGKKAAGTRKARGTDSMTTKRAPRTKKAVV